jgi:hypothetical protein
MITFARQGSFGISCFIVGAMLGASDSTMGARHAVNRVCWYVAALIGAVLTPIVRRGLRLFRNTPYLDAPIGIVLR